MNLTRQVGVGIEILFLVLTVLLFLTLGSDVPDQIRLRVWWVGFLAAGIWLFQFRFMLRRVMESPTALFFLAFLLFLAVRTFWAAGLMKSDFDSIRLYESSLPVWLPAFASFLIGYGVVQTRRSADRLLWALGWSGFFLALNVIPAVLLYGHPWYASGEGRLSFFHPIFYPLPFVSRYVLGTFAHVNYSGDVMAIGAFAAFGILFYFKTISRFWLSMTLASVIILAVLMLLSRGTVLCFSLAFFVFWLAATVRFPSHSTRLAAVAVIIFLIGFFFWMGSLQDTWREIQTLGSELDPDFQGSFQANREGARRALEIYRTFPLSGAGTGGYEVWAVPFAGAGTESWPLIRFKAMCHYLEVLAEEGIGAYFYFLMILAYGFEMIRGFIKSASRFQFLSALALFSAVGMILIHASFNHLMDRFSISTLVYLLMGASLAILRHDFEHS